MPAAAGLAQAFFRVHVPGLLLLAEAVRQPPLAVFVVPMVMVVRIVLAYFRVHLSGLLLRAGVVRQLPPDVSAVRMVMLNQGLPPRQASL